MSTAFRKRKRRLLFIYHNLLRIYIFTVTIPGRQEAEYNPLAGSFILSPRRSHIRDAGERTIATEIFCSPQLDMSSEPQNTLRKAFSSYGDLDPIFFQTISKYMECVTATAGTTLWRQGEQASGLYVVESGVLRASYTFANPMQQFEESMVAGTLAGELSALAEAPRNATVVVEHGPATLWKLSGTSLRQLQTEEPELARVFIQLVLKGGSVIGRYMVY
jgi:SulP family sulfate permease